LAANPYTKQQPDFVQFRTSGTDLAARLGKPAGIRWCVFFKSRKEIHFLIMVEKGGLAMNLLRKCSCLLLLAFLTAYGGVALAALTPSLPSKSDNVSVVQAQPDTPVDCKKTPNDPRCKPIGRAGFAFFSSPDAAGGPLREPAPNLAMSDK
jgi:hypothetical protein